MRGIDQGLACALAGAPSRSLVCHFHPCKYITDYQLVIGIGLDPPPPKEEDEMKTYVIRRERAWQSAEELEATAARSKQVAESDFPDDIAWIRSYVINEPGGSLGTVCIYQGDEDSVRRHAERVDMPADEILEVADTVIIRPDPQPETAPN